VNPLRVVFVNDAKTSPLTPLVTPAWLQDCATACLTQLLDHVAPVYGGTYELRVGANSTDIQDGEVVFAIVDDLPDAPGAIAYHSTNGGDVPTAFLALSTCGTLDDVSTAISHELVETAGDQSCDLWADDGRGYEWARELCDAVESNSYQVNGIAVSDFLLPGFFGQNDPGPYSFLQANPTLAHKLVGIPSGSFQTAAGGYQIKRTAGTNAVDGAVRLKRLDKFEHWSSRPSRRMRRP
jgi:hypothetical protein